VIKVINNAAQENTKKYKIVSGWNEHYLVEEINKQIEEGYIPTGRMFLDNTYFKQTMIHGSLLNNLDVFTKKVILEGSNSSHPSK
jgi:hypothetical protein